MIVIGKSPYRISLLGGGSDLDWFIEDNEYGLSLGYSLDLHSYSVINKLSESSKFGTLNYSTRETYTKHEDIVHPLIREAFKVVNLDSLIELSTYGSATGGSGLGGSSSFLVSLISALSKLLKLDWNNELIAQKASEVELSKLSKPIGRQDHYLSSLGGISFLKFNKGGLVKKKKLSIQKEILLRRLIDNFYLIPTNATRNADTILSSIKDDPSSNSMLCDIREIAKTFLETNENREYVLESKFHECVKSSWEIKRKMNNVMHKTLEEQYDYLNKVFPNNWIRLLGAGGGGFFLISLKDEIKNLDKLQEFHKLENIKKASISDLGAQAEFF